MVRMTNGDLEAKSAGINKNNFIYLCAQLASGCYPVRIINGDLETKSAGINKNNFIYLCAQLASRCYLVRPEGLEPPTFRIGICCDIQLRYGRLTQNKNTPQLMDIIQQKNIIINIQLYIKKTYVIE